MKLDDFKTIVDSIELDERGCKVWTGSKAGRGYAYVRIGDQQIYGHRLILELKLKRPIKKRLQALHICDNAACVNSDHLYEGDQKQNVKDAFERKRLVRKTGAKHWNARAVVEIKSKQMFVTIRAAALFYKTSPQVIKEICKGRKDNYQGYKFAYADSLISCEHANNIHIAE